MIKIITAENVYGPAEDSQFLVDVLSNVAVKNLSVCEIGCGTGIVGLTLARLGAKVTLADSNIAAVRLTQENAKANKLPVNVVQSDIFENVSGTFDLIISNPPYLPAQKGEEDDELARSIVGGKRGYEWTLRFFEQAREHLHPEGKIIVLLSSLSKPEIALKQIRAEGFVGRKISERPMGGFEQLFAYEFTFSPSLVSVRKDGFSSVAPLAFGKRGLVFIAKHKQYGNCVLKIKNPDSSVNTLAHEASILQLVNGKNIGPKILAKKKDYLVLSFVDGDHFRTVWEKSDKNVRLDLLAAVFDQILVLDAMQISKFELTRPTKNILVHNGVITLLDFERARKSPRPQNVTQFSQFVLLQSPKITAKAKKEIIDVLLEYGASYDAKKAVLVKALMLDTFKKYG